MAQLETHSKRINHLILKEKNMAHAKLAAEQMVERVENAVTETKTLLMETADPDERVRLEKKLDGLEIILSTNSDRFRRVKTDADVLKAAYLVGNPADRKYRFGADPKHHEAVTLVQGYLMEYFNAPA